VRVGEYRDGKLARQSFLSSDKLPQHAFITDFFDGCFRLVVSVDEKAIK
jgi:hypothetical protein